MLKRDPDGRIPTCELRMRVEDSVLVEGDGGAFTTTEDGRALTTGPGDSDGVTAGATVIEGEVGEEREEAVFVR